MTVSGTAYQCHPLVARRLETGSTSSELYPTPTSRDWKDGTAKSCRNVPANALLGRVVHLRNSEDGLTEDGGSLDPTFVEHLQGFPEGWTDLSR